MSEKMSIAQKGNHNLKRGRTAESLYRKKLREDGWKVSFIPFTMYGQKDLFDCFDMVATKDGLVKFIQVKACKKFNIDKCKEIKMDSVKKCLVIFDKETKEFTEEEI